MVRMRDITDGTSVTYLIGEKSLNSDSYYDSEDPGDDQCPYMGHDWDIARYTALDMAPMQDTPAYDDYRGFGSAHASSSSTWPFATAQFARSIIRSTTKPTVGWATARTA